MMENTNRRDCVCVLKSARFMKKGAHATSTSCAQVLCITCLVHVTKTTHQCRARHTSRIKFKTCRSSMQLQLGYAATSGRRQWRVLERTFLHHVGGARVNGCATDVTKDT